MRMYSIKLYSLYCITDTKKYTNGIQLLVFRYYIASVWVCPGWIWDMAFGGCRNIKGVGYHNFQIPG